MMELGSTATVALNFVTLWLLIEAYMMKPRGFIGPPWYVVTAYAVTLGAIVLLAINFTIWSMAVLKSWMTYGT